METQKKDFIQNYNHFTITSLYKDTLEREVFNATRLEFMVLCTIEVQVEPVSQFYLEEDSDQVLSFFLWYIDDEATKTKMCTCMF